jgi:hypothetical protein
MLLDGNDAWGGRMPGPEGLAETACGRVGSACLPEEPVDGLAVDSAGLGEGIPLLLKLHVRLVDAPGVVRCSEMRTTPLLELRRIALPPTKHGRMIGGDAALLHQCFDITVAQGIVEIPRTPPTMLSAAK